MPETAQGIILMRFKYVSGLTATQVFESIIGAETIFRDEVSGIKLTENMAFSYAWLISIEVCKP